MTGEAPILLFVDDRPVLSSLEFALALEGFTVAEGTAAKGGISSAACLVVDQEYRDSGSAFLEALRRSGYHIPAILLVTNPTSAMRETAAALDFVLIEKPLLGEELTHALREALRQVRLPS